MPNITIIFTTVYTASENTRNIAPAKYTPGDERFVMQSSKVAVLRMF